MQSLAHLDLPQCLLGEAPWWDVETQKLLFVDIDGFKIHRFDPIARTTETIDVGTHVSFAIPDQNGALIAGLRDEIYRLSFDHAGKELLARPASMPSDSRFNDGICDRKGRLWCGTISLNPERPPTSALYCFDGNTLREMQSGVRTSNGTGWSPDNKTMYYADTRTQQITQYDFDLDTGLITNRRLFASVSPETGRPDGLTVDSQGRVLVAAWAGGRINIYTPDGKMDDVIHLPVSNVSSLTFGGVDLRTLYITTAEEGLTPSQRQQMPLGGHVFSVAMPVPGLPETRFKSKGSKREP